jgi:hypothetical protein
MAAVFESKRIGTHEIRLEGELLYLIQHGDYTLSDAQAVGREIEVLLQHRGRAYVIVDQTDAGKTPPEARRALVEWNQKHHISGAVIFGSSGAARAMATLVLSALRIIQRGAAPIWFVDSEADARAFIEKLRARDAP